MNRPAERWLRVTADCASITGWRRTVSTTLVAIATRRVSARDRAGHGERVEVAMRRVRDLGEVGELRRPDRVRPEAHEVIGQPDRVVAPVVDLGEPAEVERQRGSQERGQLEGHGPVIVRPTTRERRCVEIELASAI